MKESAIIFMVIDGKIIVSVKGKLHNGMVVDFGVLKASVANPM